MLVLPYYKGYGPLICSSLPIFDGVWKLS